MGLLLTTTQIERHWPHAPHSLVEGIAGSSSHWFDQFGIRAREARDLMAQISEECNAGTELEENLNYSAERLVAVWPHRFPNAQSAQPYAHNPRGLADAVYNGRLGNRRDSDDGWNFRGRGGLQLTGRDNYDAIGGMLSLDLIGHPDLVTTPFLFLAVSIATWLHLGLNSDADNGNFKHETLRLNGGTEGLGAREVWRKRWAPEFGL